MSFGFSTSLCFSIVFCLIILGADAIGNRPFRSKKDVEAAGNKFKPSFGRLGLPCAFAGSKCFDKRSICVDVGAGKRDVCQCEESHSEVEGKCQPKPADEGKVTAASFGGCPYASALADKYNNEKEKETIQNLAVEAAASIASI